MVGGAPPNRVTGPAGPPNCRPAADLSAQAQIGWDRAKPATLENYYLPILEGRHVGPAFDMAADQGRTHDHNRPDPSPAAI